MLKRFLNYVEIQTKITSFFTFILILGVMIYQDIPINVIPTLVFFLGMFTFDLTTTAINNYIDSKTNNQNLGFSRTQAKAILFTLLGISIALGITLVFLTDWIVLILGMFCFGVGILYTYGPVPISRQPYGEIISGVMYGYFIPFIMLYINLGSQILAISFNEWATVTLNLKYFIGFLIAGLTPTLLTANIMLGNNTCDVEADIKVKRFTLPYYLGRYNAVVLMRIVYLLVYVGVILGVMFKVYHPIVLMVLVTCIPVMKRVSKFKEVMIKRVSFVNVIQNFILVMVAMNILVYISILLK